jgi:hypothetical protein
MRQRIRPIEISEELTEKCDAPNQFKNFDTLVGSVLAVPRAEIARRERAYKKDSARNPNRRGPKPKQEAKD